MDQESGDTLDDELDIKPIITPNPSHITNGLGLSSTHLTPSQPSPTKKWLPGSWQDANRKSAFQPYKQSSTCTVLTNLQRGNTQAETPVPEPSEISFHMLAGQGELSSNDIKKEKNINLPDENGLTALHWAAAYGQLNTVNLLLQNGAIIDKTTEDGETPLIFASSGGHHDVVRLLLEKGAKVNHTDDVGNAPLMFAARGNHPHSCHELLLHGADITMVNMNEDNAYNLAVENNASLAQAVLENFILSTIEK